MKFKTMIAVTMFTSLLLSAPVIAVGAEGKSTIRSETNDATIILADLHELSARVESGEGDLGRLTSAQLRDFRNNRNTVVELLHGRAFVQDLPMEQRIRAHNALEAIAAIVNQKPEGEQIVCRRERAVGTRMPQTVCRSVADSRADRDSAADAMRRLPVEPQPNP